MLSRLRRYAEALQCFDKTIQINPEHRLAWRNRGIVLNAAGRPREAIKSFEKAIALSRDASAYQNKALAEALLKDWRAEIVTWESFLRAFSDDASQRDSIENAKVRLNELRNGWRAKASKLFWR
jgi:tetratricopeptide (TPR) repeat protein